MTVVQQQMWRRRGSAAVKFELWAESAKEFNISQRAVAASGACRTPKSQMFR